MHVLIVGTTRSGKTTLARKLARQAFNKGRGVLVLDPLLDPKWRENGADFVTDSSEMFLEKAKQNKNCTLLIDEAGESCGQHNKEMYWFATQARHWGHQTIFISQRANMVARSIRDNCDKLFCFRVSYDDAKLLKNDFCFKDLDACPDFEQGQFIYAPRYGVPQNMNIFYENNA